MVAGFGILRLGGIDQTEKLVDFETFWRASKELLQLRCGFWEVAGIILRDGRLEGVIQIFARSAASRRALCASRRARQEHPRAKSQRPRVSDVHNLRMLAPDRSSLFRWEAKKAARN